MSTSVSAATINITDFGAVPNDGGDDLVSIRKAIASAQVGDTVFFPKGTWSVRGSIILTHSVKLIGAGIDATTIQAVGWNRSRPFIDLVSIRDCEIGHFSIDALGSKHCSQGIEAGGSSQLHIHHVRISNLVDTESFGPHGIYFSESVTDSVIEKCIISNIGINTEWGAGIRIHKGSHRNVIRGNRIDRTGRGGILCAASRDLKILDNVISHSGYSDGEGLGIELFDRSDRGLVEGNTVDHWISFDTSHGMAVRRNRVGTHDGSHKWAGLELADSVFCVFTDNTVDGGAQVGISISNSEAKEYVFWGRNTIRRCTMWGAQIQGEKAAAQSMYFYENHFIETFSDHTDALYPGGFGFRINDNTHHLTFEQNRFEQNGAAGLQVLGDKVSDLTFFENQIVNNKDAAITFESAISLRWGNNVVTGNLKNDDGLKVVPIDRAAISITSPQTAVVGIPVFFKCLAPTTDLDQLLWDFGDGLPANAIGPSHTFSTPGEYKVTLIVWDKTGRASRVEKPIVVSRNPGR